MAWKTHNGPLGEPQAESLSGAVAPFVTGFAPDGNQARVLRSEARQGILKCTRQWGKSTVTAAKAVKYAYEHAESLVLVVSPSMRQSDEYLAKVEKVVGLQGIKPRGDGHNAASLLLPNGSRIIGLPGNEKTTRGFSAVDMLLVDEAARVEDELYKALRPALATRNGAVWLMSTPCGKRGFFWEAWRSADEWDRVEVTCHECPRLSEAFLAQELRTLGPRLFAQEYLCEFMDLDGGLFDRELIERAIRNGVEPLRFR
jgi:hypothetical protein